MGIRNLFRFIREYAPGAISVMRVDQLRGKIIAIDASIAVYQWCHAGVEARILNARGQFVNHIQGAFFRVSALLAAGILPVFIFDGPPPAVKQPVLAARQRSRAPPGREVFDEVMKLLRLMKIPVIQAPSEAEAQASFLNRTGVLDAVASEDGDTLVFGAKYMIRGLNPSAKEVEMISTDKLLLALGLNQRQFIDLCILLGSDYTPALRGVGYKKAFTLIKKYKNIESIPNLKDISPPDWNYEAARAEFFAPPVIQISPVPTKYELAADDISILRTYLIDIHGLTPNRVLGRLAKLSKIVI